MKRVGKIAVLLACTLALNAGLRAAAVVSPDNPYAPIVARNVFGLNPPQSVDATTNTEPPPKITLNGIMTIFGSGQALFKISIPGKAGMPAKDQDYVLGEGERQDDIAVTRIDEKAGVVTFNNHGEVQEIPLTAAPASTAPSLTPVNNNGRRFGGVGRGRGAGNGSTSPTFGDYSPPPVQPPMNQPTASQQPGSQLSGGQQASQIPPGMTPEEQIIEIEANRILTQQQVTEGSAPPFPITELTPSDATGPGGLPLRGNPDTSGEDNSPPR